jgi:ATP-dependent Clp protease ATP-binding subunit ClpB
MEALRASFRPEFLNRVDEVVIFEPLSRKHIAQIVDIQVDRMRKLLEEKRLELELTDGARSFLAERGYDPTFGARPLKRAIQRSLQDPLALKVLAGEFLPGDTVLVDAGRDELRMTKKARA